MNVVDMHCDTIAELYNNYRLGKQISILENSLHIDLKKMQKGKYLLQNFALFTDIKEHEKAFEYAMQLVDVFYTQLEPDEELIGIVKSWSDIEKNRKAGKMSALLTLEEGGMCQGNLAYLRNFYRLGARMMTLTWNYPNEIGFPNQIEENEQTGVPRMVPDKEHGLTEKGISFIEEMEHLGMIIDISHLSDAGIWDVFKHTKNPLVASHSNARAVTSHPRNLTDDMIRALADRGGVTGINYCASFLSEDKDGVMPKHSYFKDMVRHMKHIKQIGGIGCIGLGSDFDGIMNTVEMGDCAGMQLLAEEMERQGFTIGEIEAVFSQNVLRVYKEIL